MTNTSHPGHADYRANAPRPVLSVAPPEDDETRQDRVDSAFLDHEGLQLLSELRDCRTVPSGPSRARGFLKWTAKWDRLHVDFEEGHR